RHGYPQQSSDVYVNCTNMSNHRRARRMAPNRESTSAPANPPRATAANGTCHLASATPAPMNNAPASPAAVPMGVIPPEVPGGTIFPEIMDLGSPARIPSSVAQVSEADAASAPAPIAGQREEGQSR